jgi:hypothetical protein
MTEIAKAKGLHQGDYQKECTVPQRVDASNTTEINGLK